MAEGEVVPIPSLPALSIRIASVRRPRRSVEKTIELVPVLKFWPRKAEMAPVEVALFVTSLALKVKRDPVEVADCWFEMLKRFWVVPEDRADDVATSRTACGVEVPMPKKPFVLSTAR